MVMAVIFAVVVSMAVVIVPVVGTVEVMVLVGACLVGHPRRLTSCAYLRTQAIGRWEAFAAAKHPQVVKRARVRR